MIRPATKIALEILSLSVAATAVLLAVLVWRLQSGPLSISFLTDVLEDIANAELQEGRLGIGDAALRWSSEDRALALRLSNVLLKKEDGDEIVAVPEMDVRLSVPALARGAIRPTSVDFIGISIKLTRTLEAGIQWGFVTRGGEETSEFIGPLLEQLAGDTVEQDSILQELVQFGIRNADLTFDDKVNGVVWRAPHADLRMVRDELGLAGRLEADIDLDQSLSHLILNGRLDRGETQAQLNARITDLVPAALARLSPAFADYRGFDFAMSATGTLDIEPNGRMIAATLAIDAGEGEILLPDIKPEPITIDQAHAKLELDAVGHVLTLSSLAYEAGGNKGQAKGTLAYVLHDGLNVASARVDLAFSDMMIEAEDFLDGIVPLDAVILKGTVDFDKLAADIDELTLRVGDTRLTFAGRIENGEGSPALRMTGEVSDVSLETLPGLWPIPLAKGARRWAVKNLSDGAITNGQFKVDVPAGMLAAADEGEGIPNERLQFDFTASGLTVDYLHPMPPMRDVKARASLQGDRFDAWVDSATITLGDAPPIKASNGHFVDDSLHAKGSLGHIAFTLTGDTASILALIDQEPLGFISKFGVDPWTVGGTGHVAANLSLPLTKDVTLDQISFNGEGRVDDLTLAGIFGDVSIDGGGLDLKVARDGLTAQGRIQLNGVPADLVWTELFEPKKGKPSTTYDVTADLDDTARAALGLSLGGLVEETAHARAVLVGKGDNLTGGHVWADVTGGVLKQDDIGWRKPSGIPAQADFDLQFEKTGGYRLSNIKLTGEDIEANGELRLDKDGRILFADFPVMNLGPANAFVFKADRGEDDVLALRAVGPRFDARGVLSDILSGGAPPDGQSPDVAPPEERMTIHAVFDTARANRDVELSGVAVDASFTGRDMMQLAARAVDQKGTAIEASIVPDKDRTRRLTVRSTDAGMVFRAIDFYGSVAGGDLKLDAIYDDKELGAPMTGLLTVDKFRVIDAPILAKLLTVGSLTGISDTMQGEGIYFKALNMPFRTTAQRVHVEDARMAGPAIGLTAKGQIDRQSGELDLGGTLVPAYTLNSLLGGIPLLGDLIIGREGEGVFALTYSMKGQAADPSIIVNPLAAFAPGFLRRMFEFGSSLPPEEPASILPEKPSPETQAAPDTPTPGTPNLADPILEPAN